MHGLVSLLSQPYYEKVEALWKELEEDCSLRGIRATPFPHFSWQIAGEYDFDRLEVIMKEVASNTVPLEIQTSGIGLFTGPRPVIYVSIVKSPALMDFQNTLWERTQEVSQETSPYYSPELWIPHISLAYEDVDQMNIAAVIGKLAFDSFVWKMTVDNLSLIFQPSGATGSLWYHFKFTSPSHS